MVNFFYLIFKSDNLKIFKSNIAFYLFAALPMLFWGIAYVWMKVVLQYYGPFTTTFIRLTISGSLLIIFSVLFKKFDRIRKQDYLMFFFLTLIDPLGYFICESVGLTLVSALLGSIIISTIPVISAVLAYFFLREKLSWINIAGAILSFAGIAIMILKPDLSLAASPFGIILMFGAVACAIIYSIIMKKLSERYSAYTLITVQNSFGALYFLPLFLIFEFSHFRQVSLSLTSSQSFELYSNILLLAVFGSTLAFIIYLMVLKKIGIAKTNMFVNLIPVFTLIASYLILKEMMTFSNIIGMSVVILGLYLSQIQKKTSV